MEFDIFSDRRFFDMECSLVGGDGDCSVSYSLVDAETGLWEGAGSGCMGLSDLKNRIRQLAFQSVVMVESARNIQYHSYLFEKHIFHHFGWVCRVTESFSLLLLGHSLFIQ